MHELTNEQIIKAIDAAPAQVQEVLRSATTAKTIATIGATHHLHIDQIGALATINRNLLVGLVDPSEMYGELIALSIQPDTAKLIMNDINQKIFLPLREQMRAGQSTTPTRIQTSAPAPTSQNIISTPAPYEPILPAPRQSIPAPSLIQAQPPTPKTVYSTPSSIAPEHVAHNQWPGAPAGNWQPAAAVHVYVPGPAPTHMSPVVPITQQQTTLAMGYQPAHDTLSAPIIPQTTDAQTRPPQVLQPPRTTAPPPPNLPGAHRDEPIERSYVADPYHEPI